MKSVKVGKELVPVGTGLQLRMVKHQPWVRFRYNGPWMLAQVVGRGPSASLVRVRTTTGVSLPVDRQSCQVCVPPPSANAVRVHLMLDAGGHQFFPTEKLVRARVKAARKSGYDANAYVLDLDLPRDAEELATLLNNAPRLFQQAVPL